MEVGQVCVKTKGREAGRKVIVLSGVTDGKVLVDGEKVKRRNCNILHLFPVKEKVAVKEGATHEEVLKAVKKW